MKRWEENVVKFTKNQSKMCKIFENERLERMKIDDIDKQILSEVSKNGRIPAKELARKLDVHHNTLLQRLKRLERSRVILKYTAEVDYDRLGYDLEVVIFLKVMKGIPHDDTGINGLIPGGQEKLDHLLNMKELKSFHAITGEWDVVSIWGARNKRHLSYIIKEVSSHPAITKTESHVILYTYKNSHQFNPFAKQSKNTISLLSIS